MPNNEAPRILPDALSLQEGMVLSVNKPLHWTSFDVIKKLRGALAVRKMGHAGTLDPLATGLLLICTGKHTKRINEYQDQEKVYTGEMVLGKTTPSVDLETPFDSEKPYGDVTEAAVHQLAQTFTGHIQQVPPVYSAIKTQGKRAYKMVRKGQEVTLAAREVFVRSFVITAIKLPHIEFEITCGKGTYIRSLVRDLGEQLGTGAYLSQLCRTRIGDFRLEEAYEVDTLAKV